MENSRRDVLLASGAAFVLSGCTGDGSDGTPEPTSTPTGEHDEEDSHDDESHGEGESHDEDQDHDDGIPDEPADSAEVVMVTSEDGTGFHFEPHVVWVDPGGTVSWTIESGDHSTTAYHPDNDRPLRTPDDGNAWDSGILTERGASFEHTFEIAGIYDYYCIPHEAAGMVGSIIVGRPDPEGQPGLAAPQSDLPEQARETIETRNATVTELLEDDHHDDEG